MTKKDKISPELLRLQAQWSRLRQAQGAIQQSGPTKKKAKGSSQKLQNTFEKNLRGVPGGRSLVAQMDAPRTGCRVVSEEQQKRLGPMRSARNSNTTQGSYITTVLQDQTTDVISNAQGRDVR